ncbi:MAG: hypothetical protein ACRDRA_01245 [Pseudonocardiaceae bacterium]
MRRPGSAAPHHNGQEPGLPAEVEELLVEVIADGFTLYCCGPKAAPNALVACYEWHHYCDLLTIGDFARVITARVPTHGRRVDIFTPKIVAGPTKVHPSTRCGPYSTWCTLITPTPPPSTIQHRRVCGFPAPSNAP